MWVIQVTSNLNHQRDLHISQILDQAIDCKYLNKVLGNKKWSSTQIIQVASVWKTIGGAQRIISQFESFDQISKSHWTNPFNWVKDSHLSIRKLTVEEWHLIVDYKIKILENSYQQSKSKLIKKRSQFK